MGWWKNSNVTAYLIKRYGYIEPDAIQVGRALNHCRTLPGTDIPLKKFDAPEIAAWMAVLQLGPGGYWENDAQYKSILEMTIGLDYQADKIDSFAYRLLLAQLSQFDEAERLRNLEAIAKDTAESIVQELDAVGDENFELAAALFWQFRADLWIALSKFSADVYGAGFEEPPCYAYVHDYCYEGNEEHSEAGLKALEEKVFAHRNRMEFIKGREMFCKQLNEMPDFETANKFGNLVIEEIWNSGFGYFFAPY